MTTYTLVVRRRKVDWVTQLRWEWLMYDQPHRQHGYTERGITQTRWGARHAAQKAARRHNRNQRHFNDQEHVATLELE